MGLLIDASVLIEYERGRIDLEAKLADREEEEFFLSVITASELLHGVHRAGHFHIRAKRSAFVEAVLERFPILQPPRPMARRHGARTWSDFGDGQPARIQTSSRTCRRIVVSRVPL
jgi:tRNA(fMet)-specific endonuclease VapC